MEKPIKQTSGKSYIPGIHCDATNCEYNDQECKCFADTISVGTQAAKCSHDTECATFKQKH